ncbi:MAG: hypothetical protein IT429_13455 [Gemmataceae bacterium]|nr:hypothetical protein [Gemmataceae bacterium]
MWMYAIHYLGPPNSRRLVIQRNDDRFWSGSGWVDHHSNALLYHSIHDAQADYRALQQPLIRGKPSRLFSCTFSVSVIGDDIDKITARDVKHYLGRLMHIGLDFEAVRADSPLADCHVECRVKLQALRESRRRKRKP